LPQVDRSGHEMTGVGHDMVTRRINGVLYRTRTAIQVCR
jgi:hypothetical protein